MDSFEINKIAGAFLGTLTVLLGINAISHGLFTQHAPEKPGYEVAAKKDEGGGEKAAAGGGGVAALLASADPAKGEQAAKKCAACHSFGKGEPAKVGPNLFGVIGAKHAHQDGFGYSEAMKKTSGETWGFENMDKWLENPKGYIPGTSMAFAGIKAPEERANLIAYMNKNSEKPLPLPKAEEGAKAAEGGAAAAGGAGGGAIAAKVAAADPAKGEQAVKKCAACHSFKKGEPAKVGPNLYGVMGGKHAHQEGFGYSEAMKKTSGETWTFENMDQWLENPKGYIPGTSMAYAGVKNADERAAIIAFLNKSSDNPLPTDAPAGGDKKAEGAAPAAGGAEQPAGAPDQATLAEKKVAAKPTENQAPAAPAEPQTASPSVEARPGESAPPPAADQKPAEQAAAPAAAPAAGGGEVEGLLAKADPAKGEEVFQQCAACHTINKGGEAGAGPNLYGIVGAKHAHQEGFEYSDALKSKQGPWTFAELDKWLEDPAAYAPGNMMPFPGVKDAQERANLIAYLNKNSDKPLEVPAAK